MHPLEALEAAEREFAAGNYVESSRILWQATESTYAMMGKALGLDTSNLIEVADSLDRKFGGSDSKSKYHYRGYLIACGLMRDHAEMEALEYYELEGPHRRLPPFVRQCYRKFGSNDSGK